MGMRKKIRNKKGSNTKFRSNEYLNNLYNQALKLRTPQNSLIWLEEFSDEYVDQYIQKLKNGTLTKEEQIEFDKKFIKFLVC
ncbi:TPA: hypothetical protein ACOTHO_001395 [Clostridium perfringens]|uniref:hypothetical protein n=1 Tax=Clostridium perfringens TaxID=1502 RepID=UPI000D9384E2|nr:hypothetical protein [Clostridium perfringens]MDK0668863.1 hypothetical protein [Clostridium perfringens]MDK0686860.1 hypothetical protein [Clostridium perfringens]MDK0805257.1 hypothetical protein [Clostridium perfringens]MDM0618340.1 hypothetical protein [Clostridium perfringens]MDM0991324.1 hypothetical protein [Clostridium perfringens]